MSTPTLSLRRKAAPPPLSGIVHGLPQVNLLPPEFAEAKAFARLKVVAAGTVALSLLAVGGGFVLAQGSVSDAQDQLDALTASTASLQGQVRALADVPEQQAAADAARQARQTALGDEVRWSSFLTTLTSTTHAGIGITDVTVSQQLPDDQASDGEAVPGLATVTYSGTASQYADVAGFLESRAASDELSQPFLSTAVTNAAAPGVIWSTSGVVGECAVPLGPRASEISGELGKGAASAAAPVATTATTGAAATTTHVTAAVACADGTDSDDKEADK